MNDKLADEIEQWRHWKRHGYTTADCRMSFDELCDLAIAALRRSQPEGMVTVRGMKLADEMVDAMNQCRLSLEGSARQAEWRSAHDKARRELFAMLSAAEAKP